MASEQEDINAATAALARIPGLKVSIVSALADRQAKLEAALADVELSKSDREALNAAVLLGNEDMNAIADAVIAGTPAPPEPSPVEPVPVP